MTLLLGFLFVANISDYCFTVYLLEHGAREANPIIAWLFTVHPLAPLAWKLSIVALFIWYARMNWNEQWVRGATWAMVCTFALLTCYQVGLVMGGRHV